MRYPQTRMSWPMRILVAALALAFAATLLWSLAALASK